MNVTKIKGASVVTKMEENDEQRRFYLKESVENAKNAIDNYDFDDGIGSGSAHIACDIIKTPLYYQLRKLCPLKAVDLDEGYKAFNDICEYANQKTVFAPTLNTFCRFMNIATSTLKSIAQENNERGAIATMIIEHLGDRLMQNMLSGTTSPIPSMFVAKSNFNMKENDNATINILNVNDTPRDIDDILKEFKSITNS